MKITAEQACINYAIASIKVSRLTKELGQCLCERIKEYEAFCVSNLSNEVIKTPDSCLFELFHQDRYADDCCQECDRALDLIRQRRPFRAKLGAAKRSILAIGKRLNAGGEA